MKILFDHLSSEPEVLKPDLLINDEAGRSTECMAMIKDESYRILLSKEHPSNHKVYRQCKKPPTGAKFVFVGSIYNDASGLYKEVKMHRIQETTYSLQSLPALQSSFTPPTSDEPIHKPIQHRHGNEDQIQTRAAADRQRAKNEWRRAASQSEAATCSLNLASASSQYITFRSFMPPSGSSSPPYRHRQ